jgi:hypothetical protein
MPATISRLRPMRSESARADLFQTHPRGGEEEREDAPGHAVIEVVDKARLADARQIAVGNSRPPKNLSLGDLVCGSGARGPRLMDNVM